MRPGKTRMGVANDFVEVYHEQVEVEVGPFGVEVVGQTALAVGDVCHGDIDMWEAERDAAGVVQDVPAIVAAQVLEGIERGVSAAVDYAAGRLVIAAPAADPGEERFANGVRGVIFQLQREERLVYAGGQSHAHGGADAGGDIAPWYGAVGGEQVRVMDGQGVPVQAHLRAAGGVAVGIAVNPLLIVGDEQAKQTPLLWIGKDRGRRAGAQIGDLDQAAGFRVKLKSDQAIGQFHKRTS